MLAVNTLAPYLLTGLIERPERLIYLTSDMHVSGDDSLHDLDWDTRRWNATQAYRDSKLFVTALALAAARRWPDIISHAVDPACGYPPAWAAPPPPTTSNKGTSPKPGSPSATVPTPSAAGESGTTADQPPSRPQHAIAASRIDSSSNWPRKPD